MQFALACCHAPFDHRSLINFKIAFWRIPIKITHQSQKVDVWNEKDQIERENPGSGFKEPQSPFSHMEFFEAFLPMGMAHHLCRTGLRCK